MAYVIQTHVRNDIGTLQTYWFTGRSWSDEYPDAMVYSHEHAQSDRYAADAKALKLWGSATYHGSTIERIED